MRLTINPKHITHATHEENGDLTKLVIYFVSGKKLVFATNSEKVVADIILCSDHLKDMFNDISEEIRCISK